MADQNDEPTPAQQRLIGTVEWAIAGVSGLLVLLLVGYLILVALTDHGGAPRLVVTMEALDQSRPGYVPVTVRNEGGGSAAAVRIAGVLADGTEATADLDYSPARSASGATLVFPRAVSPDEITLRVLGFSDP